MGEQERRGSALITGVGSHTVRLLCSVVLMLALSVYSVHASVVASATELRVLPQTE